MSAEEMSNSVINMSLIAIKEYGALFECSLAEEAGKKCPKVTYWVIGYL